MGPSTLEGLTTEIGINIPRQGRNFYLRLSLAARAKLKSKTRSGVTGC
jgi:hypothetical protein